MEKIAIGALLAECMTLIIKKIKGLVGSNTRTSHVSYPSQKHNKPSGRAESSSTHVKQNTNVARFNLLAIRDLFVEFKVDVNRGAALKVLLDTIKAKTYSNLVNDFYYSVTDVTSLLHKWNSTNCRQYDIHPITSDNGGVYVLREDLDLYLRNRQIFVQQNTTSEQKMELLINYSFKEGYDRFIKRYESRVNILKSDYSCTEAFDSIMSEMKSYLDFR